MSNKYHTTNTYCKVCFDAKKDEKTYKSHNVKLNGIVVCPTLLNNICKYCNKKGHTLTYCETLKKKQQNCDVKFTQLHPPEYKIKNENFPCLHQKKTINTNIISFTNIITNTLKTKTEFKNSEKFNSENIKIPCASIVAYNSYVMGKSWATDDDDDEDDYDDDDISIDSNDYEYERNSNGFIDSY
jgi:hypothetical protein